MAKFNNSRSKGATATIETPYYNSATFNAKKLPIKETFNFYKVSSDRKVFHRS